MLLDFIKLFNIIQRKLRTLSMEIDQRPTVNSIARTGALQVRSTATSSHTATAVCAHFLPNARDAAPEI